MLTSLPPRPGPVSAFDFTEVVFGHLPRVDQRRWAHAYLGALLATPGKKSVRRLAESLAGSTSTAQSLHQFVNASPWPWEPAYGELLRWAEEHTVPRAWTIDVSVVRKRGEHSCGVHRRFVPSTGRSVNCQVGIGAFLVTDDDALPVGWRLLLPRLWTEDPARRSRTRIPQDVDARGLETCALELVRAMGERSRLGEVPFVADLSSHCPGTSLIRGLGRSHRDFLVGVPARFPVVPDRHLRVRPCDSAAPLVTPAADLFEAARDQHLVGSHTIRDGIGRPLTFRTALVRLPGPVADPAAARAYRLIAGPARGTGPQTLWLTNMVSRRLDDVLRLTRLRTRSTQTLERLEQDYGMADFEGRSYPGWHHHMALMSAAYMHARLGTDAPALARAS
ncbi:MULTISPECIES: transposase [unclassified Streptomyces]|uniref:IS701 family transposase n=1 Tax=unclassified Streptomyces TaxID=2593676 RepID=UPI002E2B746C|nr:transposase [Streptomyces sp. NBC_00441]